MKVADEIYQMILDDLHITYDIDPSTERRIENEIWPESNIFRHIAIRLRIACQEPAVHDFFVIMYCEQNQGMWRLLNLISLRKLRE